MPSSANTSAMSEAGLEGRRVLLTGHRGFIGSTLLSALKANGCIVSALEGDIAAPGVWSAVEPDHDFVVNLAAVENQPSFERELAVNAVAVHDLARHVASLRRKPVIVFASSTNIWGGVTDEVVDEQTADTPASLWSAHKALAEHYLQVFGEQGVRSVILRLPNVLGCCADPTVMNRSAVNRAIEACVRDKALTVYANKNCFRDYLDVADIANVFLGSMRHADEMSRHPRVIVGSGNRTRIIDVWREIARAHEELTSARVEIGENSMPLNAFAMRSCVTGNTLAVRLLGYAPSISLGDSIRRTMRYYLQGKQA